MSIVGTYLFEHIAKDVPRRLHVERDTLLEEGSSADLVHVG